MTAVTVKRDARGTATPDKAREPGQSEAAHFGKLLRPRRRGAAGDGDEAPRADGFPAPFPGAWLVALSGLSRPRRDSAEAARPPTPALLQAAPEAPAFSTGVETTVRANRPGGAEIELRFTNGAWAGLEMQAALHAGEVVVKLRPANRLQHKRLTEASASLTGRIREETGEAVQLEIADATR